MKTYTKTVQVTNPRLIIQYDESSESPRVENDNLGYFITAERDNYSPDRNITIENIVSETAEEADNAKDHMKMITRRFKNDMGEKVLAIYPVSKYEHSGGSYSLGERHGFDYSNCGFYIVTDEIAKKIGTPARSFGKVIQQELEDFNHWINGEVYRFTLLDENGEDEDSCGGFYDFEAIQQNLPKEWATERMEDYFVKR